MLLVIMICDILCDWEIKKGYVIFVWVFWDFVDWEIMDYFVWFLGILYFFMFLIYGYVFWIYDYYFYDCKYL